MVLRVGDQKARVAMFSPLEVPAATVGETV